MTVFTHAMLAAAGFVLFLIAQVEECRKLGISQGDDIPTRATVTSVGTAARHELLPAKANAAPAAVAGDNPNFDFVNEFHASASAAIITVSAGKKKAPNGAFFKAFRCGSLRDDVNPFSFSIEPVIKNHAIDLSKQGVVPAHAHILSRVNTGPQLSNDYIAGGDRLPAKDLDAATLPLTVSTVAGTSPGFLMCHFKFLSYASIPMIFKVVWCCL
jgi:hypothetical protein